MGPRGVVPLAARVASDEEIQDNLRVRSTTCARRRPPPGQEGSLARGTRCCCSWESCSGFSSTPSPALDRRVAEGSPRRRRRGLHLPGATTRRPTRRRLSSPSLSRRAPRRSRRRGGSARTSAPSPSAATGATNARHRAGLQAARARDVGDLKDDRARLRRGRPGVGAGAQPRRPGSRCPRGGATRSGTCSGDDAVVAHVRASRAGGTRSGGGTAFRRVARVPHEPDDVACADLGAVRRER